MKKRQGSTLVMVLMIFLVLSILATATLSFMVSENKQSIYQKDKIAAYYIARSGAEAVEAAILDMDDEKRENLLKTLPKTVEIDGMNFDNGDLEHVNLKKEDNNMIIESKGKVGTSSETVKKIMEWTVAGKEGIIIEGPPLIALETLSDNIIEYNEASEKKIAIIGNKEDYPLYNLPEGFKWEGFESDGSDNYETLDSSIDKKTTLGEDGKTTNYIVNGNLEISLHKPNVNIKGKVNIFVKNNLDIKIKQSSINGKDTDNPNNLNFFIIDGGVTLNFDHGTMKANIISRSEKNVNINVQNSSGKDDFLGSIYVPRSTIIIGASSLKKDFTYRGIMLANNIKLEQENGNHDKGFLKKLAESNNIQDNGSIEVTIPVGSEGDKFKKSYYK